MYIVDRCDNHSGLSESNDSIYPAFAMIQFFYSSISSPAPVPPGILPSFNSFSSLVISCRLFAFRIIASTLFFSLSVSFTR